MAAAKWPSRNFAQGIDQALHGITYSVKDLIAVKGVEMEVNSRLTAGFVPSEDATVIKKMREKQAPLALARSRRTSLPGDGASPRQRIRGEMDRVCRAARAVVRGQLWRGVRVPRQSGQTAPVL